MDKKSLHSIPVTELLKELESDAKQGIASAEAEARVSKWGLNTVDTAGGKNPWKILLDQFTNIMVYLLLAAAALSLWFEEYPDAIAIAVVLLLNAGIGFVMELQAERSMNALKKMAVAPAHVIRDGRVQKIPSENIVPGDVLSLEAGDMIPADARVLEHSLLSANEASLTGEAMPVEKSTEETPADALLAERYNMVYKGTFVTNGNSKALVVATGMETELGKIAGMLKGAVSTSTPLEKKLNLFSRKLIYITLALVGLIFVVSLLQQPDYIQLIKTSIALAVAAIPEGLPIVATLALAQGMLLLAKHKVIVKKLSAVETLGSTTVICTDKTGTLTRNKIEVSRIIAAGTEQQKGAAMLARIAVLCNTASIHINGNKIEEIGDPLETGLLKYAHYMGLSIEELRKEFPKTNEIPFSSETKMMTTVHKSASGSISFAKGAAEVMLQCSTHFIQGDDVIELADDERKRWHELSEEFAASGLRVIGGAYKEKEARAEGTDKDFIFAGLYGMIDPPADGVKEAIRECRDAGIGVVMITGDHPATATFIARELGIADDDHKTISGRDMAALKELSDTDRETWQNATVFARVSPGQKFDLVTVLQEKGHIVAMTGDGVNDAPALKQADIGIAMGVRGTQVAQEVSDMILKDDSFASIVQAVKQGRIIFGNIQKFVIYLLSCNLSELLVVSLIAMISSNIQLAALQILFINLVTDVLPALALGVSKGSDEVMKSKPRDPAEPLLDSGQWKGVWLYAAVIAICTLGAPFIYRLMFGNVDDGAANNILFLTLIFCQLFHVFNMAPVNVSLFKSEVTGNRYVWFALLACSIIIAAVVLVEPLRNALSVHIPDASQWVVIISSALVSVLLNFALRRLMRGVLNT